MILKDCKTILHEADKLAKDAPMKAAFFFARELGKIITIGSHITKPELRCDQCSAPRLITFMAMGEHPARLGYKQDQEAFYWKHSSSPQSC